MMREGGCLELWLKLFEADILRVCSSMSVNKAHSIIACNRLGQIWVQLECAQQVRRTCALIEFLNVLAGLGNFQAFREPV